MIMIRSIFWPTIENVIPLKIYRGKVCACAGSRRSQLKVSSLSQSMFTVSVVVVVAAVAVAVAAFLPLLRVK